MSFVPFRSRFQKLPFSSVSMSLVGEKCSYAGNMLCFLAFSLFITPVIVFLFIALMLPARTLAQGQDMPLVVGQSCALTGPARNLGLEMRAGLLAAFAHINASGGVNGRPIQLISLDDSYEPDKAVANSIRLINEHQAFLLIGEVGTPTSRSVLPLVKRYGIPFFAPLTGDELLRSPFNRLIVNARPSYYQEMETIVNYLVGKKHFRRIACFYQNDTYGFAGLNGLKLALGKRGLDVVARGSYDRNTVAVMGALIEIDKAAPDAIVMVGAYSACAEFIKLYKAKSNNNPLFCNISFVGTESLYNALGAYGRDVIVSQVVPYPVSSDLAIISEYKAAMNRYQHDAPISFITLEGYIAGKLFAVVARLVPGELTRDKFIDTLETIGRFDLGGLILQFGKYDHQGMDDIYLTEIYPSIHLIDKD